MRGVSLAASCGVKAYGVAMTTLEQVFLRLGMCISYRVTIVPVILYPSLMMNQSQATSDRESGVSELLSKRAVEETQENENGESSGDAASTSGAYAEAAAPNSSSGAGPAITYTTSALKKQPQSATNEAFTADGGAGVYEEMGTKNSSQMNLNGNGVVANGVTPKQKSSADVVRELAEVLQNQVEVPIQNRCY